MKIQPVRGTHDLYGEQLLKYKKIEEIVKVQAGIYDFAELITPIFESTDLFKKPLGEESDVVLKEMYTFKDRNGSMLTLRPEHTTPMLRAAISNNFIEKLPVKLYGMGAVFRRERPQKGRYRQFNQINFEILGADSIMADVDLILLADKIIKKILPNHKINLHINSLGDKNTLILFKKELSSYFKKKSNNLSEESQNKVLSNPLRILDSKNIDDQEINKESPKISDFFSREESDKFINIQKLLKEASVEYTLNPNLVRGLDYYCHTVFEFKSSKLGAQDTLIGGGRYNGLIKLLGGPDIPGIGWAGGIERLILLMNNGNETNNKVYFILMDKKFESYGLKIINELRKNDVKVHFDYKYNLKKSLSKANQSNIENVVIIGENEVNNNLCTLKNLKTNTQQTIVINQLIKNLTQ
jgi:histidyl-tRNA synthetase